MLEPDTDQINERLLTRAEATDYIARVHRVQLGAQFLKLAACRGGGPVYRRFGNRALYDAADLDRWVRNRMSVRLRRANEAA